MTTPRLSIVRLPEIAEVAPAAEDSRRDCAARRSHGNTWHQALHARSATSWQEGSRSSPAMARQEPSSRETCFYSRTRWEEATDLVIAVVRLPKAVDGQKSRCEA